MTWQYVDSNNKTIMRTNANGNSESMLASALTTDEIILPADIPNPNVAIYAQIAALEATMTPRRTREAMAGMAGAATWMQTLDSQIRALRAQLK